MDAAAFDELRSLRARAYGPDADILDDPAALARLHELEDLAAPAPPVEPLDEPAAVEPPAALPDQDGSEALDDALPVTDAVVSASATDDGRRRRWSSRRLLVTAIAVLAVAVVVTAAATAFFTRRAGYAGAVEAVLPSVPDVDWPEYFGTPDEKGKQYAEFAGLTLFSTEAGFWGGSQADACLIVVQTDSLETDGSSSIGFSFSGCGAGPFPATLEFLVTGDMPDELRDRYPEGTALQFVLEGNEVVVLSGERGE
jgi:hypothetical protein